MALSKGAKGINITIGGDVAGLGEALKSSENQITRLSKEVRAINKELKFDPTNTVLLTQRVEALKEEWNATGEKLKLLKDKQEQVNKKVDEFGNKIADADIRNFNREVEITQNVYSSLEKSIDTANKELSEGKAEFKQAKPAVKEFGASLEETGKKTSLFGSLLKANLGANFISGIAGTIKNALGNAARSLGDYVKQGIESIKAMEESSSQLRQVMSNTMGASEAEVRAIQALASEQEKLGVVSAQTQIAGAQELSTYLSKSTTLKKLLPVMNDMAAQQYGYNATAENTTGIATMLGKVMDGQVGALSRYGYTFDENQEKILKFGTEEERAAVLADVVSQSVGGMNQALGETDEGNMIRLNASLGETQTTIAGLVGGFIGQIKGILLPLIDDTTKSIAAFLEKNKEKIQGVIDKFGEFISFIQNMFASLKKMLTENEDRFAEFKKNITSTIQAAYQKIQPILEQLKEMFSLALTAIKSAWDTWGSNLIVSIQTTFNTIKGVISSELKILEGLFDIALGIIQGDWERAFGGLETYTDGVMGSIKSIVQGAINSILNGVNSLINGLNKILNTKIEPIKLWLDDSEITTGGGRLKLSDEVTKSYKTGNELLEDFQDNFKQAGKETKKFGYAVEGTADEVVDLDSALDRIGDTGEKSAGKAKKEISELEKELKSFENRKGLSDVTAQDEFDTLIELRKKYVDIYGESSDEILDIDKKLHSARKQVEEEALKDMEKTAAALTVALETQAGRKYENETYAISKSVKEFENGLKEQEAAETQRIKNSTNDNKAYLNLKEKAVSDSQKSEIKALEQHFRDTAQILNDDQYEKLKIYEDATKEWLWEYDYRTDEQLDITKEKKTEEIAYLQSKNNEYIKEIQQLNNELALALLPLLDEENKITEAQKKRSAEKKKAKREEALAEAELAVQQAKDDEAREKAEKRLLALRADNEEEDLRAQEAEELSKIKEEKQKLTEEHNQKVAELQEKIATNTEKIADFMSRILGDYEEIGEGINSQELEKTKEDIPKIAAEMLKLGESETKAISNILEEYNPNWRNNAKSALDFYKEGLEEKRPEMVESAEEIGQYIGSGFIHGLKEKEEDIKAEAQRIADIVRKTIESALDIHSPSRVMQRIGNFIGEGLAIGLSDMAEKVKKVSERIAQAAIPDIKNGVMVPFTAKTTGIENALGTIQSAADNLGIGTAGSATQKPSSNKPSVKEGLTLQIILQVENFNNNTNTELDEIGENIAFRTKQALRGMGLA